MASTIKVTNIDTPDGTGSITIDRPTVLQAGDIVTADIADNAVTLAKMAGGVDGNIISYDASGDPVAVVTGSSGQVLTSAGAGAPPTFAAAAGGGVLVQHVYNIVTAVATSSTQMPYDDTIPQNTEGIELITQAITPTNASNILIITIVADVRTNNATEIATMALFQDSTAGALSAMLGCYAGGLANQGVSRTWIHYMVAGTTSSTTFKFRAGSSGANTLTFNGQVGNRRLGGVNGSAMSIMEVEP
jgi:hypothetical protein